MASEKSITRTPADIGPQSAAPALQAESELHIAIVAHGNAKWRGTRAQIEADVPIPGDVEWPMGIHPVQWCDGCFHHSLSRIKPDHIKSRSSSWVQRDTDLWCLTRTYLPHLHDGFANARIHQLRKALDYELSCGSEAAVDECTRHEIARRDRRFQSVLSRLAAGGG